MAGFACSRRRFIKEHLVAANCFFEGVACGTSNILMGAFQRELRLLVIKERGPPLVAVVACGTVICARAELVRVRVFVTLGAGSAGTREINMPHRQFHIWRLV